MGNFLSKSKAIPFLVAFVVVAGVLYWRKGVGPAGLPADTQAHPSSLLDFKAEYADSVEVAHWIFENHNCRTCHTLSEAGHMGLTDLGKRRSQGFIGCPGMLQAVWKTVEVPEADWTEQQAKARADFETFGCVTCHQVGEDSVDLTEIGSRAAVLHMSCSDVMSALTK